MTEVIDITAEAVIPVRELRFRASRSSGPGGQGVNTTDARVELWFDVAGSGSLSPAQRERLLRVLRGRLDQQGRLRIVAGRSRSQLQNRREAVARLQALLADALRARPDRRPTRPGAAARRRRLDAKRKQAARKRARRNPRAGHDD
ncbi:MAG TPA: alternative ribosome rescue aminoacyl-tRNA hydrolase ArfB [Actinomycetes bacterium]|nr:alternative ribosome rescue aminoacyl-tRNA hydrolase ArfB [Actinomycetes bacterium]